MKVTINIDCSPEEARVFMGLPDVRAMQERLVKDMEARLHETMGAMAPESLLKTWLPVGMQGAEQMQKMLWSQWQNMFSGASGRPTGEGKEP